MESSLIESIVAALAPEASEEKRAAGALACRTIHAALAGHVAASLPAPPPPAPSPPVPDTPVAAIVSRLRGMPMEQVFDLAINRLQVAVAAREQASPAPPNSPPPPGGSEASPRPPPMRFQMVPVPPAPGARRVR